MRRFATFIFVLIILAAAAGSTTAQSIYVTIDNAPVRFTGTQPMQIITPSEHDRLYVHDHEPVGSFQGRRNDID